MIKISKKKKIKVSSEIFIIIDSLAKNQGSSLEDVIATLLKLSSKELYEAGLIEKDLYLYLKEI